MGYLKGKTLGQFLRKWETFAGVRGSYSFAAQQLDPESIEIIADLLKDDARPTAPMLFGWTELIDRIVNLGDQMIASRGGDPKKIKFYPRPVLPASSYRKKRAYAAIDDDIALAQQRHAERRKALKHN